MTKRNKIMAGIGAGILLSGGGIFLAGDEVPPIEVVNPQQIVWEKPTTDLEWAEDVKKENFDIKSTGVLEEMIQVHTAKLEKKIRSDSKIIDCPECVKYEIKQNHDGRGNRELFTQAQIDTEYADQLKNYYADTEKLQQSIERMNKEVELREKGAVVVDDGTKPLLGSQRGKIIRKIND